MQMQIHKQAMFAVSLDSRTFFYALRPVGTSKLVIYIKIRCSVAPLHASPPPFLMKCLNMFSKSEFHFFYMSYGIISLYLMGVLG